MNMKNNSIYFGRDHAVRCWFSLWIRFQIDFKSPSFGKICEELDVFINSDFTYSFWTNDHDL